MSKLDSAQLLRETIAPSSLFIEGTEHFSLTLPTNTYYGFNVTKTDREPIDQIHGFVAAKRIQERNLEFGERGYFFPFIAGVFEVLNAKNAEERDSIVKINSEKDKKKEVIFQNILEKYNLNGKVLLTHHLWQDNQYWNIFSKLIEDNRFSRGSLIQDSLKWYKSKEELMSVIKIRDVAPGLMKLPSILEKKIGSWPAAIIYTPIEVAEAHYLREVKNVLCKIGHMEERVYDKYIISIMDIIHLRQPTDMKSSRVKPRGVTPYIDKERRDRKIRIFFDDTVNTIKERISDFPPEEYTFTLLEDIGEVLNPILDKVVLAIESARCLGKTPISIAGVDCENGEDIIMAACKKEVDIADIYEVLPQVVYEFVIRPFNNNQDS